MLILGIAGNSGVGKTTIIKHLSKLHSYGVIETDCFHKWERGAPEWNVTGLTHLHPDANDLDAQLQCLRLIYDGQPVTYREYHHNDGRFADAISIYDPTKYSMHILCGLLPFYGESRKYYDLTIFIDMDDDLQQYFKVNRDVRNRGYTEDAVIDSIRRRDPHYRCFVLPQKLNADIVIHVKQTSSLVYDIAIKNYPCKSNTFNNLNDAVHFIHEYINCHKDYYQICRRYGGIQELFQANGGNVSVKSTAGPIIVKKSGFRVSDPNNHCWSTESPCANASIEVHFHMMTKKYTVHAHPTHVINSQATKVIERLKRRYKVGVIGYAKPGEQCAEKIKSTCSGCDILILENHGIIYTADDVQYLDTMIIDSMSCLSEIAHIGRCLEVVPWHCSLIIHTSFLSVPNGMPCEINMYTPDVCVMLGCTFWDMELTSWTNCQAGSVIGIMKSKFFIFARSKAKCKDLEEILYAYIDLYKSGMQKCLSASDVRELVTWDKEIMRQNMATCGKQPVHM